MGHKAERIAFFINAKEKKVEEFVLPKNEVANLKTLQEKVEGYIERAGKLPTGESLWVNEEGLLRKFPYGFKLGASDIYRGNGVVSFETRPAKVTRHQLETMVEWK